MGLQQQKTTQGSKGWKFFLCLCLFWNLQCKFLSFFGQKLLELLKMQAQDSAFKLLQWRHIQYGIAFYDSCVCLLLISKTALSDVACCDDITQGTCGKSVLISMKNPGLTGHHLLMCEFKALTPSMFLCLFVFYSQCLFPYTATSHSGLEVTPGPINHSNRQQQKYISQMKHLFYSASQPLHSPPSISLLPHFFIRLLMVYKLHIMVPPLPCAEAFFMVSQPLWGRTLTNGSQQLKQWSCEQSWWRLNC